MSLPPEARAALEATPLLRLLSIAGHITSQRWTRITSEHHGLTPAGVSVLVVLGLGSGVPPGVTPEEGRPGRATHKDLARRCWIRPATLTGIVDTLIRAGLVRRERDEDDRRQVWITLTPVGRERVKEISKALRNTVVVTSVEQDPAKAAVIREYLIELIATYRSEENADDDSGGGGSRPGQAVPEAPGERG
jgi:DNA-binding MarR family transcriptional regulator